jgi:hypothetical protein
LGYSVLFFIQTCCPILELQIKLIEIAKKRGWGYSSSIKPSMHEVPSPALKENNSLFPTRRWILVNMTKTHVPLP